MARLAWGRLTIAQMQWTDRVSEGGSVVVGGAGDCANAMRQTGFLRAYERRDCSGITKRIGDQRISSSSCINTCCYSLRYGAKFFF